MKKLTTPDSVKVAVAQLGARKHYLEPILFEQWGILNKLYTDLYADKFPFSLFLNRNLSFSNISAITKITGRYAPELDSKKVVHFPQLAFNYSRELAAAQVSELSDIYLKGGKQICELIIRHGIGDANTVYGFNSACLELFQVYKPRGIYCILDQTIAELSLMYRLLLAEEANWPGWMKEPYTVNDSDWQLAAREQQEQDLADRIICGSQFVKDSLIDRGVAAEKISVVTMGRVQERSHLDPSQLLRSTNRKAELNILFAGHVDLRKGVPYLLEALQQISGRIPFTCKIAGSLGIHDEIVNQFSDVCTFLGRVPRSQMQELYAWADIFVLPSICEGSAMVVYEALLNGLPAIVTPNTGSIVRDGVDGYIVPMRDAEAIGDRLTHFYETKDDWFSPNNTQAYAKKVYLNSQAILKQTLIYK